MNDSYYAPPQMPPQEPKKPTSTVEVVSLVLGIIALICICCCGFAALPFGIGAIVCAAVSRSQNGKMSGVAITGLVMGIVSVVFGLIGVIFSLVYYTGGLDNIMSELNYYLDNSGYYGY